LHNRVFCFFPADAAGEALILPADAAGEALIL
jgi:hypothetical protein